jgi:hypothetical protein
MDVGKPPPSVLELESRPAPSPGPLLHQPIFTVVIEAGYRSVRVFNVIVPPRPTGTQ